MWGPRGAVGVLKEPHGGLEGGFRDWERLWGATAQGASRDQAVESHRTMGGSGGHNG
jgi:hypothetical protein